MINEKVKKEFVSTLVFLKKEKPEMFAMVIKKTLQDSGVISDVEARKLMADKIKLSDLKTEEGVLLYSYLFKQGIVKLPVEYFFTALEIEKTERFINVFDGGLVEKLALGKRNFYNSARKIEHIKEVYPLETEPSLRAKVIKFDAIGVIENKYNIDCCEFNKEQLYEIFEMMDSVTWSSFSVFKSLISAYYVWCYEQGYIMENKIRMLEDVDYDGVDCSRGFKKSFLKDTEDVKGFVKSVLSVISHPSNWSYYDTSIALLYLSWFGIDQKVSYLLKKSDLRIKEDSFQYRDNKGEIHVFPINQGEEEFLQFIEKYCDSKEGGSYFNKNKQETYANDIYLLRNSRATSHLPLYEMSALMVKFKTATSKLPPSSKYHNTNVTFSAIKKSGGFYRLYLYEQEHGEIAIRNNIEVAVDVVERIARETFSNKYYVGGYLQEYRKWRKYFHNI